MTDLKNGIIELEEMTITPETTKNDLMKVYGEKFDTLMSTEKTLYFNRLFRVDNYVFMVTFFLENDKISSLELWPSVQYKSKREDRTGRQEERREFCDKWLYERLGEPHENINGDIEYSFETVRIGCFSNFDIREGANAGFIVVSFLNNR